VFTWTPSEDQGPDVYVFDVVVSDGVAEDRETISVTVSETNDPPVLDLVGPQFGDELTLISFTATASDVDVPVQTLMFSLDGSVPSGASIGELSGVFEWTPSEDQGPAVYTFDVVVSDGIDEDRETVDVTVYEVNVGPVLGLIGPQSVLEETLLSFTATATDDDVPVQILVFSLEDGVSGSVPTGAVITSGGIFTWTPTEEQSPGVYTFDVVVKDDDLAEDRETITVTVDEVNDPPIAFDDEYDTNEDIPLHIEVPGVLGNDIDSDGPQTLTTSLVDGVSHGTLNLNSDGSFEYIPRDNWFGVDSFAYRTYDGDDYSDAAMVNISVHSINDPPNTPSYPTPVDGETNVDITVILRWRGTEPGSLFEYDPEGDPVTFDVYFGTNSSPPLMVLNQSNTSYDPNIGYNTVYYWRIIAWDNHNASNTSDLWRFTTKNKPPEGGGGNDRPVADASAGEPYTGFIDENITFDGSGSYDSDGQIIGYRWDFNNDGIYDTGWLTSPISKHAYSREGRYTIILQVKDNNEATDTDSTTATIVQANIPPTAPIIEGPHSGHQNVSYEFTALSYDADNDTIQYIFDWGDGETTRTTFLQNGTSTLQTHTWTQYGEYIVTVKAFDNRSESGTTELTVLIDVLPIDDEITGYLVDQDSESTYDLFDNTVTGKKMAVKKEANNTYLIDNNGDGKWDYAYTLGKGLSTYSTYVYQKYYRLYQTEISTPGFEMLLFLAMMLVVFGILRYRKKQR
ncbi:MAG: tandem-95 repeat protein, partial [Methanobacteriota archaeon]